MAIEVDGVVAATGGEPSARDQRFPLAYAGETIGTLVIGTSLGPAELRLIDDLAPTSVWCCTPTASRAICNCRGSA